MSTCPMEKNYNVENNKDKMPRLPLSTKIMSDGIPHN